jgi:hypothetical protein
MSKKSLLAQVLNQSFGRLENTKMSPDRSNILRECQNPSNPPASKVAGFSTSLDHSEGNIS